MKKIEKPQEYYDLISEYNQMQKQCIELQAKMRETSAKLSELNRRLEQDDYNTKISPVKEEDYYIQVPISVHNEGIRALATLANITAIIALEEDNYIDAKPLRALLGLSQKGDK